MLTKPMQLAAALFLIFFSASLFAEDVKVGILPMSYSKDIPQLEVLSRTIPDTIALTLRILKGYSVKDLRGDYVAGEIPSVDEYAALCDTHGIDVLFYGESEILPDGGGYRFTVSAFNPVEGKEILSKNEIAPGIFDVFDAADNLTIALLESFSNTNLSFSRLVFQSRENREGYAVYIDGEYIGDDLRVIDKVPVGKRSIEIRFIEAGKEYPIMEREITLESGGTTEISFNLPLISPYRAEKLKALDRWVLKEGIETESGQKTLARLKGEIDEVNALKPGPGGEYLTSKYGQVLHEYQALYRPEKILSEYTVPVRNIKVDGSLDDWFGIPSFIGSEPEQELLERGPGTRYESARFALDWKREHLYFALEIEGEGMREDLEYVVGLFTETAASYLAFHKAKDQVLCYLYTYNPFSKKYRSNLISKFRLNSPNEHGFVSEGENLIEGKLHIEEDLEIVRVAFDIGFIGIKSRDTRTEIKDPENSYDVAPSKVTVRDFTLEPYAAVEKNYDAVWKKNKSTDLMKKIASATSLGKIEDQVKINLTDEFVKDLRQGNVIPQVSDDWFTLDGKADDWVHIPVRIWNEWPHDDPAADMLNLSFAKDNEYYYGLIELDGRPTNRKYKYQLQIYDIKDDFGSDIGATLVAVDMQSGMWRCFIRRDYWEEQGGRSVSSNSKDGSGEKVVEFRFKKDVIMIEDSVIMDLVIQVYPDHNSIGTQRIDKFPFPLD